MAERQAQQHANDKPGQAGPVVPSGRTAGREAPSPGTPVSVAPSARPVPRTMLRLQRLAGNAATARLVQRGRSSPQPAEHTTAEQVTAEQVTAEQVTADRAVEPAPAVASTAEPPAGEPAADPPAVVQREAESGGLLGSALGWVRDRWNGLRQTASGAIAGARQTVTRGLGALGSAATAVTGQVSNAWQGLRTGAQQIVRGAEARGSGLLGGIMGQLGAIRSALVELDAGRLRAAWASLTGAAGQAWNAAKGIAGGALGQLSAAWGGIRSTAAGLLDGLRSRAGALIDGLPGAIGAVQARLGDLWTSLTGRVGGVLRRLPGWSVIERQWSQLRSGVQATASSLVSHARSAWQGIQARASSAWQSVQSGWEYLRKQASERAAGLVSGFQRIAGTVRSSAVDGIVSTIGKVGRFFGAIRQAVQDPGSVIDPIADSITGQLSALPERSQGEAQTRVRESAGQGPGVGGPSSANTQSTSAPAAPTTAPAVAAALPVQRQAVPGAPANDRRTAGLGEVLSTVWAHLGTKLSQLMGRLGAEIKKMLLSLVWPPATWEGLKEDWSHMTTELGTRWDRFRGIRLDGLGHFWEDLRRFVSNLADFPLIIWRTANAMVGRLSVYITLLLVAAGAIAGAVGGTVGGAILGFLGGAGVGAAPGSAAGGGIGVVAGAGVGFAAAMKVGTGVLISFIAAEVATITKSIGDLLFVPQTDDEQEEDYNATADSIIALAAAGILAALTWVGTRIARSIFGLVRRIRARLARRSTPPPDDASVGAAEAVPGKLRLLARIRGSRELATRILDKLDEVRPGDRPRLEAELETLDDALARLGREADSATTPGEVQRIEAERLRIQRDLENLQRRVQAATSRFPDSWKDFDERFHEEFEAELNGFRGNQDLHPSAGLRGGEGQLFLGSNPLQALKRWFKARLGDMAESLRLLRAARSSVNGNPRLRAVMDVVEVGRTGSDWAVRGFDPDSIPLSRALGDPAAAAARAEAIAAIEGSSDAVLGSILDKLRSNSANLHWSPGRGKILVIDMQ